MRGVLSDSIFIVGLSSVLPVSSSIGERSPAGLLGMASVSWGMHSAGTFMKPRMSRRIVKLTYLDHIYSKTPRQ